MSYLRLKIVVPLVLVAVAAAAFTLPAVEMWSLGQAAATTPDQKARLGMLISAAFGIALAAVLVAWALLHAWLQRPLQALAREAAALAQTPVDRKLSMPSTHLLECLPAAVHALAQRILAAKADTAEQIRVATARAEEQRSRLEAILVDLTEGVIVCNLDNRILLYNQAAARILEHRDTLGLGRPIFGLVTSEPLLHVLEQIMPTAVAGSAAVAAGVDDDTRRFVCATLDLATLLEARLSLVRDATGAASGYVITFADVGSQIESLAVRDMILREVMVDWRRPLANLRAASETLESGDDLTEPERKAFLDIVNKEVATLNTRFAEVCRDYDRLAAGSWPMSDIHSLDLFRTIQKHLAEREGLRLTLVGVPVWLHADSHSLLLALEALLTHVGRAAGVDRLDIEARHVEARAYVEASWDGAPIPSAEIETWLDAPLEGTIANRSIRQIVDLHGSELWSEPAGPGRARIRLPLRAAIQRQSVAGTRSRPAPRPEFYDFDLFESAHAELSQTPLRRMSFVVFDTETTGLKPSQGDELISIGAVRVVNGRILTGETFERLINPGREIPDVSIRIHGITPDMVRDKPPAKIVLPQFKEFTGDAALVAYNAAFDMKFLEMKEQEARVSFDNAVLDALLLAIYLFKDAPDHSLSAMAHRLGIEIAGRHTALGDAMMTAAVWVRLLERLEAEGIDTFGKAVEISSRMMHERRLVAQF